MTKISAGVRHNVPCDLKRVSAPVFHFLDRAHPQLAVPRLCLAEALLDSTDSSFLAKLLLKLEQVEPSVTTVGVELGRACQESPRLLRLVLDPEDLSDCDEDDRVGVHVLDRVCALSHPGRLWLHRNRLGPQVTRVRTVLQSLRQEMLRYFLVVTLDFEAD